MIKIQALMLTLRTPNTVHSRNYAHGVFSAMVWLRLFMFKSFRIISLALWQSYYCPGIILGVGLTNERWRYIVTSSLNGWAHTQNDSCCPSPNEAKPERKDKNAWINQTKSLIMTDRTPPKPSTWTKLCAYYLGYIDGLVQDCSNSIVNALELLQSCAKRYILYMYKAMLCYLV